MKVADVVARMSYKPNWNITATETHLDFEIRGHDSNSREEVTWHSNFKIPPYIQGQTIPVIMAWIDSRIEERELHEKDEWLRFDGDRIATVHGEVL